MKKKLLVLVALIMTISTLATLVSFVSAKDAKDDYLYAYYSDKVVLDGKATAVGATGSVGEMGADKEYDSDLGSGADHYMEYVMDYAAGDTTIAATWSLKNKMLYIMIDNTDAADLKIELGGKVIDVDTSAKTAEGIDGVDVEIDEVIEIAIPLEKTLTLEEANAFIVTDAKISADLDTFEGKLAFTGNVPIIVYNDKQDYYAKNIKAPDDVVKTGKSGAGRYYRQWLVNAEVVANELVLGTNYDSDQGGFLGYGYNPMYGDIEAESYTLKADVSINSLPVVDKAAIANSRDVGMNGLAYDTTMAHAAIYLANNKNAAGALMYCCSIFNTDEGLCMVINSFMGEGDVFVLGKEDGDTFELKLVNNVVAFDQASGKLEQKDYTLDVYVDGVLIGTSVNKQVKGTYVSEYGFAYNAMSLKNDNSANWRDGDFTLSNLVSAYELDFDKAALAALSATDLTITTPAEGTTDDTTADTTDETTADTTDGTTAATTADTTADTTKAPEATTKAPDTTAAPNEGGCASSLAAYGTVMVIGSAVMAVVTTSKKKEY